MDREQGLKLVMELLQLLKERGGSDLFLTAGFPPAIKVDGEITAVTGQALSPENAELLVRALMNERQAGEFDATKECQFAISPACGRFRVSAFRQQSRTGAVLRTINTEIPSFAELDLPAMLKDVVMAKRGLVLFVGATGSGKSTSLAAMIGHRNEQCAGHIISIEDPIEFVHPHRKSIITQREVGVDTDQWETALKNTLRQAPDVILIGEIRSRETMEYAVAFAETGHLVLSTLHANSANQALDRIINFFPPTQRAQVLMDLSLNLKAVVSQRLVRRVDGGRVAAMEILLNTPLIADLIFKGDVGGIKEVMERSGEQGMVTFDQFLFDLYEAGVIDYSEALRHADSANTVRLNIKLNSRRPRSESQADEAPPALRMQGDEQAEDDRDAHGLFR